MSYSYLIDRTATSFIIETVADAISVAPSPFKAVSRQGCRRRNGAAFTVIRDKLRRVLDTSKSSVEPSARYPRPPTGIAPPRRHPHDRPMPYSHRRRQQTYDHRFRDLVRSTGDPDILAGLGVPHSTALGWLRKDYPPVVTADVLNMDYMWLQAKVLRLRQRNRTLAAVVRLLLALVWALGGRLDRRRLPQGPAKARLLRAIERTENVLSLRGALRVLGLSASRYRSVQNRV